MHSSFFSKSAKARDYVRCYIQRTQLTGSSDFVQPVTARASPVLVFEFGTRPEIQHVEENIIRTADPATLVGMVTHHRARLLLRGYTECFVIVFEPVALYQLFKLPVSEYVNSDHPAQAVLGKVAATLQERLGNATTFQKRVEIADECISRWGGSGPAGTIARVAEEIVRNHGTCRMDSLAHGTGLSMRSFQRLFQERVGVSAKLFSRIVRFEAALKTKAAFPHLSWMLMAHKFGYTDQMHMIHDFRQLSGSTPTRILEQASPLFKPQMDPAAKDNSERLLL